MAPGENNVWDGADGGVSSTSSHGCILRMHLGYHPSPKIDRLCSEEQIKDPEKYIVTVIAVGAGPEGLRWVVTPSFNHT